MDERIHALGCGTDALGIITGDFLEAIRVVLDQAFGQTVHRAQWGAQIMCDGVTESLQFLVNIFDLLGPGTRERGFLLQ